MNLFRRGTPAGRLLNLHDENGRGRCVMLTSAVIVSINTWLTTGLFYTSFLMIYGINLVNISIIIFIPYIAGCFGILSPSILERFKKRRFLLAGSRLLYHTLNILGITLVPVLITDPNSRIVAFAVTIFAANLVNALTGSGYSAWHLNFIPPDIRANYFSLQSLISSFIGISASLVSGIIADALSDSPYGDTIIIALRYVAYMLAIIEIIVLLLPKEYPYPKSHSIPKIKDIFILPFTHKPFLFSIIIIFLYTYFMNVPASSLNYYLINNVGIEYTFIYAVNMVYPFTLLFLLPIARKIIAKHGWFKTFALFVFLTFPTTLMYSCVTSANYMWLFPTLRIIQHFFGTAYNLAYSNLAYVNLPREDQTNYLAFHSLSVNIAAFLGMMTGTVFIAWNGTNIVTLLGLEFTSVQILMWVQAFGQAAIPILIALCAKKLSKGSEL